MKRIIALSLLLPTAVLAQSESEVSYNYFDVAYLATNWDFGPVDVDGNGYTGRFSVEIRPHLFLAGDYGSWEFDGLSNGSTTTSFGIGSNWNLSQRWSVWGLLGVRSMDLDLGAGNMDEEAGYAAGGARWQVSEGYELRFSADYADLSPIRADEASVTVGADIYLTDVITLALDVNEHDSEATTFTIGLRFYHGKDSTRIRQRR